jgi:hypothetical protein
MNEKLLEVVMSFRDKFSPGVQGMAGKSTSAVNGLSSAFKAFGGIIAALGIGLLTRELGRLGQAAIGAAAAQEVANAKFNAALKATGNYTDATSKAVNDLATELQRTIGVSDDAVLSIAGQIEALSHLSGEALPDAIKATVQLSNVIGIDFENAGRLIAKTLASDTNALARYGIEVDTSGTKTDKLAEILEKTSVGMDIAKEKAETYTGTQKILNEIWGEYLEALGNYVVESPGVRDALKLTTIELEEQTKAVRAAQEGTDDFVGSLAIIGQSVASDLLGVLQSIGEAFGWLTIKIFEATGQLERWRHEAAIKIAGAENVETLRRMAEDQRETFYDPLTGKMVGPEADQYKWNPDTNTYGRSSAPFPGGGGGSGGGGGESAPFNFWKKPMRDLGTSIKEPLRDIDAFCDKMRLLKEAFQETAAASEDLRLRGLQKEKYFNANYARTYPKPRPDFKMRKGKGGGSSWFGEGMDTLGSNDFLWGAAGQFGSMAMQGASGGEMLGAALPMIGSAFGPVGAVIGGLLGGLFGGNKKPRGNDPSKPVFVSDVNLSNIMTELLNITKSQLGRRGAGGVNVINAMIRAQSGTSGAG